MFYAGRRTRRAAFKTVMVILLAVLVISGVQTIAAELRIAHCCAPAAPDRGVPSPAAPIHVTAHPRIPRPHVLRGAGYVWRNGQWFRSNTSSR